ALCNCTRILDCLVFFIRVSRVYMVAASHWIEEPNDAEAKRSKQVGSPRAHWLRQSSCNRATTTAKQIPCDGSVANRGAGAGLGCFETSSYAATPKIVWMN